MPQYSDDTIRDILKSVRTVAMVGASANSIRPSYFVMKYLQDKEFRVIPVNPQFAGQEILGERAYASLADVPERVDMVDIFRNSAAAGGVADQAIALKDKLGARVIWMQLGVINEDAAKRAEAAGFTVIMDRCPKIEYGRLSGDIGFMGVHRRVIDNRRKKLGAGRENLSRKPIGQRKDRT